MQHQAIQSCSLLRSTGSAGRPYTSISGCHLMNEQWAPSSDGEDLPTICNKLTGDNPAGLFARLIEFATSIGPTVEDHQFVGSTNGDCSQSEHRIRVEITNSPAQRVKTLAHEIGHVLLHEQYDDRPLTELEAESVGYVTCQALGLDRSDYSFGYVATWAGGSEQAIAGIKASCERIQKSAATILRAFEPEEREERAALAACSAAGAARFRVILVFTGIVERRYQVDGREFKDAIFDQFARVAAAFGSPKRVEIVDLLAQGERTVESIAQATGMLVANTSQHLQVLRNAGMLTSRREGLHVVYRVADDSVVAGYRGLRTLAESRISEVRQLAEAFFGELDGADPVGVQELLKRSKAGEVVVVDVRPRLEFEAGHLPGAISIPLDELSQRISELDPDTAVMAYCRGPYCVLAAQAVAQFRSAGLHAERLTAGPPDWHATGVRLAVGAAPGVLPKRHSARKQPKVKGART